MQNSPFTLSWWFWLTATGFMIAGAISVKFVGLFVVLLVGLNTAEQLWDLLGDMTLPLMHTIKHFVARAVCLIVLPISLYVFYFWIHLTVLYKS
jgi:dolichyl-phosphate-mannose-protein mannosyltransferase